jgi:hypothetical protein
MDTIKILSDAIATGEIIAIQYQGGSKPGAIREIAPLSVTGNNVRARCYESDAVKMFDIKKIVVLPRIILETDEGQWRNVAPSLYLTFKDIGELLVSVDKELKLLGWVVHSDRNKIELFSKFANGNIRKQPTVQLNYEEFKFDMVTQEDGSIKEENHHLALRPWTVRSRGLSTNTFKHFNKAADLFISQARKLSPNQKSQRS